MSQWLVRCAWFASVASLISYARSSSAQIPIVQAERLDASPPPPPTASEPPLAAPLGGAAAPGVAVSPAASPANAASPSNIASPQVPAKAALIVTPGARRAAEARAEQRDDDEEREAQLAIKSRWYGWQTLTSDAVSLSALLGGLALEGTGAGQGFAWFGLLGYEFAPGILHFAHRNPGRGFASFGVRLGLPLAGAFAGASLASNCNDLRCEVSGVAIGMLVGMGGAMAIDAAVFAYEDPTPATTGRRLGLVPLISIAPHRAWLGIGGQL